MPKMCAHLQSFKKYIKREKNESLEFWNVRGYYVNKKHLHHFMVCTGFFNLILNTPNT